LTKINNPLLSKGPLAF